jgi:hypothetical protein
MSTWKEQQRALAERARMGRVYRFSDNTARFTDGSHYEQKPNGQIINLDKKAKREAALKRKAS